MGPERKIGAEEGHRVTWGAGAYIECGYQNQEKEIEPGEAMEACRGEARGGGVGTGEDIRVERQWGRTAPEDAGAVKVGGLVQSRWVVQCAPPGPGWERYRVLGTVARNEREIERRSGGGNA